MKTKVLVLSFSMLFLESTLFSILLFTHTYLVALQVIAFALMGTGLGAVAGYWGAQREHTGADIWIFLAVPLSIIAVFLNIALFPRTVVYSPVMMLPFLLSSAVISESISRGDARSIYFFDLMGAALGVFAFVFIPSFVGQEGSLFLLALLLVTVGQALFRPTGFVKAFQFGLQALLIGAFALNMVTGLTNLANLTRCYDHTWPTKVFCRLDKNHRVLASKSDPAARVDVTSAYSPKTKRTRLWIHYNGINADKILAADSSAYINDPRVPHQLAVQPDVLVIGTAGDGIIQPARLLAGKNGRLDGVEINAGLVALMRHRFYQASGRVYDYLDNLFIGDARTYLNTHAQQYGVITLLNSYTGRLEDSRGAPDYLHTVDAMGSYINHLTPNGFLLFEVRDINDLTHVSGLRILHALINAQAQHGDDMPQDNFVVYEFYPKTQKITRGNNYTMIVFKRSAFTTQELDRLQEWIDQHNAPGEKKRVNALYFPGRQLENDYSRFVLADNGARSKFFPTASWLTTPITDDKPFMANAVQGFPQVTTMVVRTALLVIGLALLLTLVMMWSKTGGQRWMLPPFLLYFASTGAGYLLIEVALIQWLQIFTGLPAYTFVFVLGVLLLFSGLGSQFSHRLSDRQITWLLGVLVFVIWASVRFIPDLMWRLQTQSLILNSIMIALSLTPMAFLMGMPLPFGLKLLKNEFLPRDAALGFGFNSIWATLGGNASVLIALYGGFHSVFLFGVMAYVVALISLALIAIPSR